MNFVFLLERLIFIIAPSGNKYAEQVVNMNIIQIV